VPDEIMIDLIAERIAAPDCRKGFVLDGFPRTVAQAKALDTMLLGKKLSVGDVILMEVDQVQLTKRVENRVAETRARGEAVRKDDDLDTFKRRLGVYNEQTAPILPYYEAQGKIRRIDGMRSIEGVTAQIDALLSDEKSGKSGGRP
jgi:adenylate kinase